ncbi:hypothetical protein F3Y22_tig00111648pilonHSYRG00036 [Hibiscus syriacus]|uniref:Uncharacterized protein n=1 Tax=Hibiscus syriacus TaxID=106335 RepID=A0A6A2XYW7_HIBSY|nr:hypothetical protein F3Y22_tig00111648pilonHSYRG00036 [Hibiscus syriacus]
MEVESGESSTEEAELESPRSVVLQVKQKVETLVLHSQVLRIREEDLHLGEDFIVAADNNQVVFGADAVGGVLSEILVSKPILPSSPLSGKNRVKKAMQ